MKLTTDAYTAVHIIETSLNFGWKREKAGIKNQFAKSAIENL